LYEEPEILKADPHFALLKQAQASDIVLRPSAETGKNYTAVSEAYFNAVHSVLTGQKKAATAAAELETRLVQITGLKKRAPGAEILSTAKQFAPAK
jgi:trehalose/maltose transport system substrate-binding protein